MTIEAAELNVVSPSTPRKEVDLEDKGFYINRELSWLSFNERVLDQALDAGWPLLERLKFLAIFASNLDEFFMIRVSGLHEQLEAEVAESGADGLSAIEQLIQIRQIVQKDMRAASAVLTREILPALAEKGIRIASFESLTSEQKKWARAYFRRSVFPVLTPLAVDPVHPFPFLSNLSLSLAVEAEDPSTSERRFARVKVPEILPRFVPIGAGQVRRAAGQLEGAIDFLPLEELISHSLADLFPGMNIVGCYPFRVTRDMDLDILEEEADDLLFVVDREVRRRRFGAAVRLEIAPGVPERIRLLLLQKLEIEDDDVYESPEPLGLSGLFAIASTPRPELRDPLLAPRMPPEWVEDEDPFAAIDAGDIMLHHPYDSFTPVLELLRRAAEDPNVLAIKMTLYRAGANSEAVRALARAADNGKQVAVSIELKARFDEENNIGWARALERAGVHVFYGTAGLKTHAKILLIVRRDKGELRRYVHMATGNYNATTAKIYTDIALFTSDAAIGDDASDLFNALSGFSKKATYRKLAVAPTSLRDMVLGKVKEQTERARAGKAARIFAKLNSLVDTEVIRALYRASQAGVTVDLVIRGICCLRPGMDGVSDRITVRSLVGRFLEHERILIFGPPGEEEFYLTSADWMPRNFDRRVEIVFPVTSESVRDRIRRECLAPLETDNSRVYDVDSGGVYHRRRKEGAPAVDAQLRTWSVVAETGPRKPVT